MRRIMLMLIVSGIFLIPAVAQGGSDYAGTCYSERRITVRTDLYPVTVPNYARGACRETYRKNSTPRGYVEKNVEAQYSRTRPCKKRTAPERICPETRKVESCCPDSCQNLDKIRRMAFEIQKLESRLEAARESARADSIERQRLADENARWQERDRAEEIRKSQYSEWYPKFKAWERAWEARQNR